MSGSNLKKHQRESFLLFTQEGKWALESKLKFTQQDILLAHQTEGIISCEAKWHFRINTSCFHGIAHTL
jgi:hypothetical protein